MSENVCKLPRTPDDFKYSKDHEWVKIENGVAIVGITDFAQQQLTDIVFVELPKIGKEVEKGKPFAVVESVKSVSDVFAPISGNVVEANSELESNSALINQDAFGKGWIAKINPKNLSELDSLMNSKQYEEYALKGSH